MKDLKLPLVGMFTGLVIGLKTAFSEVFWFGSAILDILSFLYAGLFIECGSTDIISWCTIPTTAGIILIIIYFCFWGLISGLIVRYFLKIKKKRYTKIICTILLTIILSWGILLLLENSPRIPNLPNSIRCYDHFDRPGTNFRSFPYGSNTDKIECATYFAKKNENISWCREIPFEQARSVCVGKVAEQTNDLSLCDSEIVDIKNYCINVT